MGDQINSKTIDIIGTLDPIYGDSQSEIVKATVIRANEIERLVGIGKCALIKWQKDIRAEPERYNRFVGEEGLKSILALDPSIPGACFIFMWGVLRNFDAEGMVGEMMVMCCENNASKIIANEDYADRLLKKFGCINKEE